MTMVNIMMESGSKVRVDFFMVPSEIFPLIMQQGNVMAKVNICMLMELSTSVNGIMTEFTVKVQVGILMGISKFN